MAYSAAMKHAIGAVRRSLTALGIGVQDARFARHGEHEPAPDAPLVLVACSGGRDSLALMAVADTACAAWGVRCGAVVVDHGMQPGSAETAARAAAQCAALGADPCVVRAVQVEERGQGAEAAARDARYAALVDEARRLGAAAVLLAHTKDDQAESVLIDLIRSGGVDALAGMPPEQCVDGVRFVRPFLDVTRAATTSICEGLDLDWWDDPTNGDAFAGGEALPAHFPLRSRIRHTLLPYLNAFAGRDMVAMLADGAAIARRDVDYLDARADDVFARTVTIAYDDDGAPHAYIDARALAAEDAALRFRVVARTLSICAPGSGKRHVDAVEALVSHWRGQQAVRLPRKRTANRKKHVIEVCEDVTHANRRYRERDRS